MCDSRSIRSSHIHPPPSSARRAILAVSIAVAALLLPHRPARAQDEERPETKHLVLAGLGMAIPTYWLGVTVHEGTHAAVAKMFGADIVRFTVLPSRHPVTKHFYFGYVEYRGRLSTAQRVFFLLSPKLVDTVMVGTYAFLVGFDTLPDNHYGQLALAVLATGFWVDFSKEALLFWRGGTDVAMAYDKLGADRWYQKLPYQIVHAGLAAAGGFAIVKGYQKLLDDDDDGDGGAPAVFIAPLLRGTF